MFENYRLTPSGKRKVRGYITECKAMRKEILDAGKDTANDTHLPTIADIIEDIEFWSYDGEDYYNSWGVTDKYDGPVLSLSFEQDFAPITEEDVSC